MNHFEQLTHRRPARPLYLLTTLVLLIAQGQSAAVSAQEWVTNGNHIHNTNPGNVGIGTGATAPEQALHVNGTEILSTGTQSGFKFRDRAGGAANNWVWYSMGNVARLHRQGVGDFMAVTPSGNVGIGTLNPNAGHKLEVAGHASAFGMTLKNPGSWTQVIAGRTADMQAAFIAVPGVAYSPSTPYWAMGFSPGGGSGWSLDTYDGTNIITRVRVLAGSGNVGIANLNPLHKLDVGGNVNAAGGLCIAGDCKSSWAQVGGQWTTSSLGIHYEGANVGIGGSPTPGARLHVAGDINVTGNINAKYQDVAEWVPSTQSLAAGTVVVLDVARSNHVLASSAAYDTRVAGVVSARPGVLLGEPGEGKLMVATTGRVRVKVDATRGPVRVGDLLVTGDLEGVAMKSQPVRVGGRQMHLPGTIIGKALEPLESGLGEILVLLSLQ